jgi:hypothetical protein
MRPVVIQYVHSDHSDHSDLHPDTPTKKLESESDLEEIVGVSDQRSDRSDRSFRSDSTQITTEDWSEGTAPPSQQQIKEFFDVDPGLPWRPLPEHSLEESPCYHIIEKSEIKTTRQPYYYCKLHPNIWNIDIRGIEHHFKYKDPDLHKSEALRLALKAHTVVWRDCIK